jgi:nitric oxide reductase NorD protein
MPDPTPLEQLRIADPDTYVWVKGRVALMRPPPPDGFLRRLAEETIWALSQEPGLGRAVAQGLLQLGARPDSEATAAYIRQVRRAAETGPTLGRIMAVHLVPVLTAGAGLLARFEATVRIMRGKGTYTLSETLAVLGELLEAHDIPSAGTYLDLLAATFGQAISYNRSVRLVYMLPKAVRGFAVQRRAAQIAQLALVVRTDPRLVDPFLEGMQKGAALLAPRDLARFVARGLAHYRQSAKSGAMFLGLASEMGREACARLQKAVPLARIKGPLDRYLNARLGRPLRVVPMPAPPGAPAAHRPWVCSDRYCIYLPDEIDHFDDPAENAALGKMLVRLEAGFNEWRTFSFDLERAADLYPPVALRLGSGPPGSGPDACDAERFAACFDCPGLAGELLALFELGRVVVCASARYPGLMREALPVLRAEAGRLRQARGRGHLLAPLYTRLVLEIAPDRTPDALTPTLERSFRTHITARSPVEACAALVCLCYDRVAAAMPRRAAADPPLTVPFGWRPHWALAHRAVAPQAAAAERIKAKLAEQGLKIYRGDLQNKLADRQGRLSAEDIRALVVTREDDAARTGAAVVLDGSDVDMAAVFEAAGVGPPADDVAAGPAFRYPEWDAQLQDYLHDHVRVQPVELPADGDGDFYRGTLDRYRGLVARMRRAFELLKPEGLVMLRQWPEGDAFDHRALIDFAIDRRAGRIPSDRLFIKRLKQVRDVAVLLLVDLSRSTANPAAGGRATVLEVAKEALVLFCEALQVVGDPYAIAGFSGTGRHAVDYFCIKDFQEPLAAGVQKRISGLRPHRGTRMGAAMRHATAQLAQVPSRVRLLILVSDGFPNDLGYKGEYAIADTRRAAQEARACNVHVKAITVNIGSDPRLDDLYGRVHHHVIGDVRELPDKLLRLYGVLTRRY